MTTPVVIQVTVKNTLNEGEIILLPHGVFVRLSVHSDQAFLLRTAGGNILIPSRDSNGEYWYTNFVRTDWVELIYSFSEVAFSVNAEVPNADTRSELTTEQKLALVFLGLAVIRATM